MLTFLKDNLEIRLSKFCSMARKDGSSIKEKAVNVVLSFATIHMCPQSLWSRVTIQNSKRSFKTLIRNCMLLFQA